MLRRLGYLVLALITAGLSYWAGYIGLDSRNDRVTSIMLFLMIIGILVVTGFLVTAFKRGPKKIRNTYKDRRPWL